MKIRSMLAAVAVAALAVPTSAQPVDQQRRSDIYTRDFEALSGPHPVDDRTQADELTFKEDHNQRMTVPVSVDGTGPYAFLVDTGADRSAVSRQLALKLQLLKGAKANLHGVAGAEAVETAQVSDIRWSAQTTGQIEAALLDNYQMGADGIIGVDVLRSQRVTFDFKAHTMSIVPGEKRLQREERDPNTIVVTGRLRQGRLLLTQASTSGRRIDVVVDTGSEMTIANAEFRRFLMSRGQLRSLGMVDLNSVTGQKVPGELMVLDRLEIGGVELKDLPIVFANAHTFNQLGLNSGPAILLGMNAMRAFDKVSIDFTSRKLRLIMKEESALPHALMAEARTLSPLSR